MEETSIYIDYISLVPVHHVHGSLISSYSFDTDDASVIHINIALSVADRPQTMISRGEAIARAKQDHGDDGDIVWMNQNSCNRIYHDDPDCSHLSAATLIDFTRREAQTREYGPCKVCTLETAYTSHTGNLPIDLIETVRQKMAEE